MGIPGGDVKIPGGYTSLVDVLVSEIAEKTVESSGERIASMKLGQRVKRVDYTGDMVKVFVESTNEDIEYTSNHVIVAVPLGVLKRSHQDMFIPSLTKEKVEAIEKIEFGR